MQSYELLFDFSRETTGLILGSGPFDRSMAVWFIIFGTWAYDGSGFAHVG